MSSVVIGAFLVVGPVILIACVAIGVFGFSPERAQAIRSAEAQSSMVMDEIRRIHVRSPERFRHDRLDRHPTYICIHFAVWCYAWCIFGHQPITSNLAALSEGARIIMATCFIIGATLVLTGSAMGVRIARWTFINGVRHNVASAMLADDIRLPYTFACAGLLATGVSAGIYASTSFHSTLGSLGGWMTGMLAVSCMLLIRAFYARLRQYEHAHTILVAEAIAQIGRAHVAD